MGSPPICAVFEVVGSLFLGASLLSLLLLLFYLFCLNRRSLCSVCCVTSAIVRELKLPCSSEVHSSSQEADRISLKYHPSLNSVYLEDNAEIKKNLRVNYL